MLNNLVGLIIKDIGKNKEEPDLEISKLKLRISELEKQLTLSGNNLFKDNDIEHLKAIALTSSINGVAILNTERRIIYVNPSFVQMWGYQNDNDIIQKSSDRFWYPKTDSDNEIISNKEFAGWRGELIAIKRAGSEFDVLASIAIVKNSNSEIIGFLYSFIDNTEKNKLLNKLKNSEVKFRTLVDQAAEMLFLHDLNGNIVDVNKAAISQTGYSKEELLSLNVFDIDPDSNDRNDLIRFWHSYDLINNPFKFDVRHRRKDGSIYFAEVTISKIKISDSYYILALARDITEKKNYENQLILAKEDVQRREKINNASLELLSFAENNGIEEITEEALNIAEKLTASKIGFIHFVNDDQISLTLQNWSTRTKNDFCNAAGKGSHYDIAEAGVWVDCFYKKKPVVHNNYAKLKHKKGLPEGHAQVIRELVVPVIYGNKVKAIFGVGNKPENYNTNDVNAITIFASFVYEIIEKKRTEQALIENEKKYKHLFNLSPNSIFLINSKGKFEDCNLEAINKYGYSLEEFQKLSPIDIAGYEKRNQVKDVIKRAFTQPLHFEWTHREKSGLEFPVEIRTQPFSIFNDSFIIVEVIDITERKRNQERLEHSEFLLRNTEKLSKIGGWEWDVASKRLFWTEETYRIHDVEKEEIKYDDDKLIEFSLNCYQNEAKEEIQKAFENCCNHGISYSLEVPIVSAKGVKKWVRTSGDAIYFKGEIVKVRGNIIDITETKNAMDMLAENELKLRELLATKDKFFSIIAHDLRSPIGSFSKIIEMLYEEYDDFSDAERKDIIENIKKSSSRVYLLLENLLEWSRLQRGILSINRQIWNIKPIIQSCIEIVEDLASNKSIEITNSVSNELKIYTDKTILTTIIRNLITNAIKFTHNKGKIEIGMVSIRYENNISKDVLFVKDNGVGMNPEKIDSLFKIDLSAPSIGTSGEKGTGLGLILCKELTDSLNGKIWVESNVGRGSTFFLQI